MMKRYKVSIGDAEYRKDIESELPSVVRECIEKLIESGSNFGIIDIPDFRCEYSICPEQYFPEDMIDTIHRIAAELRTMSETIEIEIDAVQFRQTIAILRSSASRLTAAAKREHERNQDSGLCLFHQGYGEPKSALCPDCPECEKVIDRRNSEASENESEWYSAE